MIVRVDTDLVAVDVTVTDVKGNYLLDLHNNDFQLFEDGSPRAIEFFQPVGKTEHAPLAMVLALDLSGSISPDETTTQHQAIKNFIQTLDNSTLCSIVGFNYKINILQDFTSDHKKLAHTIDNIKEYGGSTRIYDALDRAVTMLKKAPAMRGGKRLRRVILVITDGFDSASIIDKQELVRRANENAITIYSITIPSYAPSLIKSSRHERLPTLLDISRITDFTGGKDFPVDSGDFSNVFNSIAQEIAAGYTLAYHLPRENRAHKFHKLEVKVNRPGAIVRASRDGYTD